MTHKLEDMTDEEVKEFIQRMKSVRKSLDERNRHLGRILRSYEK